MDIIKLSTDWARAEVFSSKIVLLFSVIQIVTAIGFWYFGKTAMAKAFFWPMLVCGIFLVAVGAGLFLANNPRIKKFETEGRENPSVFIEAELQRTAKSQGELAMVFKILPAVILVAAVVIMLMGGIYWRAIAVTLIVTSAFLMVVDSNTEARNDAYNSQLTNAIK